MYDKYDSPYSGGPEMPDDPNPAMEAVLGIAEKIKANWKKIIALIAVLAVAYFAYDFFIGSMREVQFTTQDAEGKAIQGTIKLYSQDGKEIKTLQSGQKISLREGTYYANASASDFKQLVREEVVVSNSGPVVLKLEDDKDIELEGTIPDSFFSGEQKDLQITIRNSGEATEQVVLLLEGDAKDALELDRKTFSVPSGERMENIKISAKLSKDSKAFGENKKVIIRVQGLYSSGAKIEGKYSLIKFDPKDLKVSVDSSDTEANFKKVRTGQQGPTKNIRVENKTENPVSDLRAEIEITESGFLDAEQIKDWFIFNPSNTVSIEPDSKQQVNLILRIPGDIRFPEGKISEKVTGSLTLKNSYFEKRFALLFEVEKSESKAVLEGLDDSYTFRKENNVYTPKLGFLKVRNTGDVALKDFSVRVSCEPEVEGQSWLTVENGSETTFALLQKDESRDISYRVMAPAKSKAGETSTCTIGVLYYDPSDTKLTLEDRTIIYVS